MNNRREILTNFFGGGASRLRRVFSGLKKIRLAKMAVFVIFIALGVIQFLPISQNQAKAVGTTKYARTVGGNWSADATWSTTSGGAADTVKPTAEDDVVFDANSGAVTIDATANLKSFNMTGYANTLSGTFAINVIGAATTTVSVKFAGTISWTGTLNLKPTAADTNIELTTNGKTLTAIEINGNTAGDVFLIDALTLSSSLILTNGNFHFDGASDISGLTHTIWYLGAYSLTGNIYLGNSIINLTRTNADVWNANTGTSTVIAGGSEIRIINGGGRFNSGKTYNILTFTGGGNAIDSGAICATLNITGTASKTDSLSLWASVTVTGTLNVDGNSSINRILLGSNVFGTARTITLGASATFKTNSSNVDFQDITVTGGAANERDLSAIAGGSGDCGGNTGITFTTAAAQTWTNAAGGNWSLNTNWTSRVPLPQDDVGMNRVGGYNTAVTVTADMPRLGKSIDWTGATWTGTATTFALGTDVGSYGSVTLISGITFSNPSNFGWNLSGRSSYTITSAGKSFTKVSLFAPTGTYTITDALVVVGTYYFATGTFNSAGYNVTIGNAAYGSGVTVPAVVNMGSSLWTITGSGYVWEMTATVNAGTSTIALTYTGVATTYFGTDKTYNNITIAPGSGVLTFSGAFTFANMTMSSAGTKTVKFTKSTTYTMTGTNFLSGTSGNLVTIDSDDGATAFTLSKTAGTVTADFVSLARSTAGGGATWNATHSTNTGGNTGWNFLKSAVAAGGNWSSTATWWDGVVPTASTDVYLDSVSGTSGAVVIDTPTALAKSLTCTGYTGTLTHATGNILTISGSLTLVAGMTYAPSADLAAIVINGTGIITTAGKLMGNFTVNGSGITVTLAGNFTQRATTTTLTLTLGTLNTNNQVVNIGSFATANSANAILTLGSSTINVGDTWNYNGYSSWVLNVGTSTINMTGSGAPYFAGGNKTFNNVNFTGVSGRFFQNATFANLTVNGSANKTDYFWVDGGITVTGILTLAGNSSVNRLHVRSSTIGTARTITLGASATFKTNSSNVDIQDITVTGGATNERDLSAIAGGSGDCGGNTGITFTTPTTQTFASTGGSWSDVAKWTSRVPLPQDSARFQAMSATQTITVDMPRLPNTDFSSATNTPTVNLTTTGLTYTWYGSVNLTGVGTFTDNISPTIISRTNISITSAGKSFTAQYANVAIYVPGATLTFADNFVAAYQIHIWLGTLTATGNVTCVQFLASAVATVNGGNGTWTVTGAGETYLWLAYTGATINMGSATILMTYTGATATAFAGATGTYGTISIAPGSGVLTFSGAFTFANMTMSSAGTKTVKFTKSTTYTMTGTSFLSGTAGNLVTIDSDDGATAFTLSKPSGNMVLDYVGVSRTAISGVGKWFLNANSTPFPNPNLNGNSGWSVDTTPPTNPTTTSATIDGNAVTSNSWSNSSSSPAFTFSGATDSETGLAGYYTYWDTSASGDPSVYQAHSGIDSANQYYNASGATDGAHYYFRTKTKDKSNNTSSASTLFEIKYDRTAPIRPASITASPAGYSTSNSFDFSWPDGSDPNGPGGSASGLKWYEYKRATDVAWSHTADASVKSVTAMEAYQEGANVFYARSVDNAGNPSTVYAQVTYYFSGEAPPKPDNLAVTPESSDSNAFTICWDKPAQDPGDSPIVGYRYSINEPPTAINTSYKASTASHTCVGPDAYATIQGENTVYVISQNEAGNNSYLPGYYSTDTFSCNTPAPPTPVSVSIYDSSDKVFSRFILTIQWSAGAGQDPATFNHYSLERSVDGTIYSELAQTTANTSYIDSDNLSDQTTYYYRLRAVDNAGKTSAYSSVVSAKPSGKYTSAPKITSAPVVSDIKTTSAKITWVTDRNSSSYVRYGKTDGSFTDSTGQIDAVTSHSVNLPNLSGSTHYYFQVQSLDRIRDYSPETAFSTTYSFITEAVPSISNVSASNITLTSADIIWETTTVSASKINFGKDTAYGKEVEDISGTQTTKHSAKIDQLENDTLYHFKISATDISGNILHSDDYSFKTLALPRIENLKVTEIKDRPTQTIKVTWDTNVETSTIINYSTSEISTKEKSKAKLETTHEIELEGLADDSKYTLIAQGRDKFGNLAESEKKVYQTHFDTRAPKISDIIVETNNVGLGKTEKAQIAVSWKTDEPATSQVEYGIGIDGDFTQKTVEDSTLTSSHLVIISELTPKTPYHLKVVSKDKGNNISQSDSQTIISGNVQKSILTLIINALKNVFGWVKL